MKPLTTIVLTAFKYTHLGEDTEVPGDPQGRKVERRAEAILLDRMIQVTGNDVKPLGRTMMLSGQMVLVTSNSGQMLASISAGGTLFIITHQMSTF